MREFCPPPRSRVQKVFAALGAGKKNQGTRFEIFQRCGGRLLAVPVAEAFPENEGVRVLGAFAGSVSAARAALSLAIRAVLCREVVQVQVGSENPVARGILLDGGVGFPFAPEPDVALATGSFRVDVIRSRRFDEVAGMPAEAPRLDVAVIFRVFLARVEKEYFFRSVSSL